MKLVLQNKMLASIDLLLKEGQKKGGLPKHIVLDSNEALAILRECAALKENPKWKSELIKFQSSTEIPSLVVAPTTRTSALDFNKMILEWQANDISVTYVGIPLIVDPKSAIAMVVPKETKSDKLIK